MNILRKGISLLSLRIKSQCLQKTVTNFASTLASTRSVHLCSNWLRTQALASVTQPPYNPAFRSWGLPWRSALVRTMASLAQMHRTGPHIKKRKSRNPLNGNPFAKGVVLKTLIKKPKKPNSANRKCVMVRLSNGKEMVAYVPGIGHNLQEHNIVLVRVGRLKDCPGVKLKCVRGKYDLPHVVKQKV